MESTLYSVSAISFALALILLLLHDRRLSTDLRKVELAYRRLIKWVILFCLQDAVWGICASDLVRDNLPLFISSTVFHLSTVATTFVWLYFMITYLGDRVRYPRTMLAIDGVVVLVQVVLLIINFFHPTIFHVVEGRYYTDFLRPLAFFNQYAVYLVMGVVCGIVTVAKGGPHRQQFMAVFFFSLAPVILGVAQVLYPDGPFYSMGYFFGCYIIHLFVVSKDREELHALQSHHELFEQTRLANTDELTALHNRHAYETALDEQQASPIGENLVYMAIDINGLKTVNDTIGHQAGDELIIGAAECLQKCLGAYGKVYRIGGDEFAAIIYATQQQMEFLRQDLDETVMRWQGSSISSLSISYGIAMRQELPDYSISQLAAIADERMYKAKAAYYQQKGIDRRGQQSAFAALCASYTKILKINLTTDTYSIICMDQSEQTADKGFSSRISTWLHDFGTSGQVHPDDLEQYLEATGLDAMRRYFQQGNQNLNIFYHRKNESGYRYTKMEMIPAEDYKESDMNLYLYVKDIDR